jgi:hypothetical protein
MKGCSTVLLENFQQRSITETNRNIGRIFYLDYKYMHNYMEYIQCNLLNLKVSVSENDGRPASPLCSNIRTIKDVIFLLPFVCSCNGYMIDPYIKNQN